MHIAEDPQIKPIIFCGMRCGRKRIEMWEGDGDGDGEGETDRDGKEIDMGRSWGRR